MTPEEHEKAVTPEMIAAAWSAWHSRHGGKIGPGPAFVEAIDAAYPLIREAVLREGWEPIETAPKDGTPVLVAITGGKNGDTVSEAYWHVKDANWWFASTSPDQYIFDPISDCMFGEISHWRPLPAPPAGGRDEG